MSVKHCILEKIDKMSPNDKLPSERDLIGEFGFSRPTIQKALSSLENDGIIYRVPRQGSFVSDRRLRKSLNKLKSFPEDLRSGGDIPSTRLISFETTQANETVAEKLDICTGDPVYSWSAFAAKTVTLLFTTALTLHLFHQRYYLRCIGRFYLQFY